MSYLFLSHHKCATGWISRYLSALAAENGLSYDQSHLSFTLPTSQIVFLGNACYDFVRCKGMRGCHIIRNPLSVLSSAYFSHLRTHPLEGWSQLAAQRRILRSVSRSVGFFLTLAFLERADFYTGAVGPLHGLRTWDYNDRAFLTLRIEDMVQEPSTYFRKTFAFLGFDRDLRLPDDNAFLFSALSGGRRVGETDNWSHYRSGDPEGWRRELPPTIIAYLVSHFRPMLERFYPDALEETIRSTRFSHVPLRPAQQEIDDDAAPKARESH